jgi:hypothetical protein
MLRGGEKSGKKTVNLHGLQFKRTLRGCMFNALPGLFLWGHTLITLVSVSGDLSLGRIGASFQIRARTQKT